MEKGTASIEYAIVVAAAAISNECKRKEYEKNNNESVLLSKRIKHISLQK